MIYTCIHTIENLNLVCIIKHVTFNEVHTTKSLQAHRNSIRVLCLEKDTKSI